MEEMVHSIVKEITLQKDYLKGERIKTIYFGGGTPSLLSREDFITIFSAIKKNFNIDKNPEITVEVNPDDLNESKLIDFLSVGVNRLSIGIQTFHDVQLKYLNRIHKGKDAKSAVALAQQVGFKNISIDLIYGIPSTSHDIWRNDLTIATALNVQHISAYCLTIEPKTVFGNWLSKKIIAPLDEKYNAEQLELLMENMGQCGYEQYEVSNFARSGFLSKHNSGYWQNKSYLGIGPGAHSYNLSSRQSNILNNALYIKTIKNGEIPCSMEVIDLKTAVNEYIMTRLRTKWGIDTNFIFGKGVGQPEEIKKVLTKHLNLGNIRQENSFVYLTQKGIFIADKITEELFVI